MSGTNIAMLPKWKAQFAFLLEKDFGGADEKTLSLLSAIQVRLQEGRKLNSDHATLLGKVYRAAGGK